MNSRGHKARVALKYCGCCNPQIDLGRIARQLAQSAEEGAQFRLVPLSENEIDVVVILCGCPRACGNKEDVRAKARQAMVIAGERLDGELLTEEQLTKAVKEKLKSIFKSEQVIIGENDDFRQLSVGW